jgi:hypothetical protein
MILTMIVVLFPWRGQKKAKLQSDKIILDDPVFFGE